jgi:protein-histidine pros-kinase
MPGAVELPRRPDEIHDLAVAFTTMERDLGAARRQLEARAAELEQANRLKSELVANVSHELRTPLSAIIGYSQLLLDESYASLGERERGDLTTVLTSAEHLLVVINDLLDVSRIEAGRLEIRPLVTDLREVARQACQAVERQARDKGLALECRMPDEPVWAFCDPDRLRQVLLNLVGNAVKFTYEGSVTLEAASDGDWAEVTVADTGVGIPDDQLPRIWEQFHQVDGSLTRRAGGTGLGLAITRQLVLAHGGTIGCRSEVGAGSTFTVRLPAHERAAEEAPTRGDAHLVDF